MKRCGAAKTSYPRSVESRRATFIVRMWTESGADDKGQWRGTAEYVQSGERRAVASAGQLVELLVEWLSQETE